MQFTIKNQTAGSLSYLGGAITVAASSNTNVPRDFNTLLLTDAHFLDDATNGNILLNNQFSDMSGPSIQILAQTYANFLLTPIATLPLYYSLPVSVRQSATTSSGSTVWAMRNAAASVKIVTIEQIKLRCTFDAGTPLTRKTLTYEIKRFSTATPSGGTALTPILLDTLGASTAVTDARVLDTGLTMTSVVLETASDVIACPAVEGASVEFLNNMPFKLGAGEGLAITLGSNALVGQGVSGNIVWAER